MRKGRYPYIREYFEKMILLDTDECILWPYGKRRGYGEVGIDGLPRATHALALERRTGPCPPGKEAAHLCGIHSCFNYRHLEWKTPKENHADRVRHGTHTRGIRNCKAKLTEDQVLWIRKQLGRNGAEIGRELGVSKATICKIRNGVSWSHVWN